MLNRITTAIALEAYTKTGLEPVQDHFYLEESTGICACIMGALYVASGGELENATLDAGKAETFAHQKYGRSYANGVIAGFDCTGLIESNSDEWKQGYKDGLAAWEAVKHLIKEEAE